MQRKSQISIPEAVKRNGGSPDLIGAQNEWPRASNERHSSTTPTLDDTSVDSSVLGSLNVHKTWSFWLLWPSVGFLVLRSDAAIT